MLEKELEKKFTEIVKKCDGIAFKLVFPGDAGVPDRLVVLPEGRIGFAELKQEGKEATVLQNRRIHALRELGCVACVLDREPDISRAIMYIASDAGKDPAWQDWKLKEFLEESRKREQPRSLHRTTTRDTASTV